LSGSSFGGAPKAPRELCHPKPACAGLAGIPVGRRCSCRSRSARATRAKISGP
jgi:hypothetical protein